MDPIISNPASTQSINPYSYIGNNPLSGTDPTGYMSLEGLKGVDCRYGPCSSLGGFQGGGFDVQQGQQAAGWDGGDSQTKDSGAIGAKTTQHGSSPPDSGGMKEVNKDQPSQGGGSSTFKFERQACESGAGCAIERDIADVQNGEITKEQADANKVARVGGVLTGGLIVAGALVSTEVVGAAGAVAARAPSLWEQAKQLFQRLFGSGARLENSGPIARSLGAASRGEMLARRVGLNIESPTSRQILNSLDMKVVDFIGRYRAGGIRSQFPSEFMDKTIEQALLSGGSTVRKLLLDSRFVK